MVNIKPLMGPTHPEVKSVLEQTEVRPVSPRSLSPEEEMDFTKEERPQREPIKPKKKLLQSLLDRLNILSNR